MKTRMMFSRVNLKKILASIAVALLLVVGLFLVSVILPPNNAPEHVLYAPAADASQTSLSNGVKGTIASFAALFPQIVTVNLPLIMR